MTHRVLVAGASGYIGRHVVEALLQRNYHVVAQLRAGAQWRLAHPKLECVYGELTESEQFLRDIEPCDLVISCLASRSGGARDARLVEYDANNRLLAVALKWGVQRFLLLSAICVQKPRLAFQKEKLRFEATLRESNLPWTIIRPTAFFKSLSGQIVRLKQGKPFFIFGNGTLTACKPIAEQDLATFMVEQLTHASAIGAILPIGGPGPAITPLGQAQLLGQLMQQPVKTRSLPPRLFLIAAAVLSPFGLVFSRARDQAEFLRIAHFYATESMLVWSEEAEAYSEGLTPESGSKTLSECYEQMIKGGVVSELGEHKLF
ncbi:MAG: NAD(P)H-binding protein [Luminiphilus sp.]|nr:NAD(P)H-binding protein [Luminiphilus sp.]